MQYTGRGAPCSLQLSIPPKLQFAIYEKSATHDKIAWQYLRDLIKSLAKSINAKYFLIESRVSQMNVLSTSGFIFDWIDCYSLIHCANLRSKLVARMSFFCFPTTSR